MREVFPPAVGICHMVAYSEKVRRIRNGTASERQSLITGSSSAKALKFTSLQLDRYLRTSLMLVDLPLLLPELRELLHLLLIERFRTLHGVLD